jgi:hypothetical protein
LELVKLPKKPEEAGFIELPELSYYLAWVDERNSEQDAALEDERGAE